MFAYLNLHSIIFEEMIVNVSNHQYFKGITVTHHQLVDLQNNNYSSFNAWFTKSRVQTSLGYIFFGSNSNSCFHRQSGCDFYGKVDCICSLNITKIQIMTICLAVMTHLTSWIVRNYVNVEKTIIISKCLVFNWEVNLYHDSRRVFRTWTTLKKIGVNR